MEQRRVQEYDKENENPAPCKYLYCDGPYK